MLGAAWKRWNWLDDGLIPLAGVLMIAAWSYPLFTTFLRDARTGVQNPGFTFWLCLAVLLGGFLAGRLASQNRMGIVIVIVGGMAAIFVSLLLTIPSQGQDIGTWFITMFRFVERGRLTGEVLPVPLVMIIWVAVLWTRGVRLSSMRHEGAVGSFLVGLAAIAGLLFASAVLPDSAQTGAGTQAGSTFLQNISSGLAPLALISIPIAIVLLVLASALGEWASTAGEMALVAGMLFLSLIMPFGPSVQQMAGWLFLFLASGLATLALTSAATTLREQERLTGIRLRIDRYWVMIMLAVVSAVLLSGMIISQIVAPSMVLSLLALLRPVWWVLRQVLFYIIIAFAYLFFSLLEPLLAGLQDRPARSPEAFLSPLEPQSIDELAQETGEISPAFTVIVQVLLVLGALAVLVLLFYVAAKAREKRPRELDEVIETRETILTLNLIQEQIKGLLDGLRRRTESFFVDLGPPEDSRRVVREMYQQVLALAIRLDAPRSKHQTPGTYSPTLAGLCHGEEPALETLTQVYVVARYGTEPPTDDQIQAARNAFTRIQAALQGEHRVIR